MKGRPPFRRLMPRYPMECGECGHMLDVDDARCAKCGVSRPATGWVALSQPRVRLVAVPGAYRGEVDSVEPNDAPEPTEESASPPPPVAADADKPLRLRMRSLPPAGEGQDFDAFDLLGEDTAVPAPSARGVEARDLAPGKMYAARYRVEESLPSGPGALRFVAVQEPLVRRVVLTTLLRARPTDAQIALETRFLRDAAVLARLRHPNLAPVHDFGRGPDGACFATEELLYGFSLLYLSERGSVPPARLVGIAADVASALCALHEAGVVHRAVRADHVVVGPRTWRGGPGETAQVGRYGFEILPEEAATVTDVEAALLVTPEVLAGQEPDEACDIYAVGVLIYRALAGRPPYEGSAAEVLVARAQGNPVALPRVGDDGVGDRLCEVADRCLRAAPDQRYPSARALLEELEALAALAAAPPPAAASAPPPAPEPASISARGIVFAALAGAIVPTLGLVVFVATGGLPQPAPVAPPPVVAVPVLAPVAVTGPPVAAPSPVVEEAPVAASAPAPEAAPAAEAAPVVEPAAVPVSRPSSSSRPRRAPAHGASSSDAAPAPSEPVSAPVTAAPVSAPWPPPPEPVAAPAPAPAPTPVAEDASGPEMAGAAALSGLWLGKAPGGSLVLDLTIDGSGRVTGRAKRTDGGADGLVRGHVSAAEDGLRVELQVTEGGVTTTYSGLVDPDGELRGKIYAGGKSLGRFSARR